MSRITLPTMSIGPSNLNLIAPTASRQRPAPTQPPRKPAGPGLSDGAIGGNPAAAPRGGGARGPRSGKSWERGGPRSGKSWERGGPRSGSSWERGGPRSGSSWERGARVPASRGNAGGPQSGSSWEHGGPGGGAVEGNIHLSRLAGGHRVQGQPACDFKGMANPQRLHDMVI